MSSTVLSTRPTGCSWVIHNHILVPLCIWGVKIESSIRFVIWPSIDSISHLMFINNPRQIIWNVDKFLSPFVLKHVFAAFGKSSSSVLCPAGNLALCTTTRLLLKRLLAPKKSFSWRLSYGTVNSPTRQSLGLCIDCLYFCTQITTAMYYVGNEYKKKCL